MMKGQKQKLKFLTSIPAVISVFVIIYASLGIVYFNRHSQSRDLASQITLKRTVLQRPQPNIKELNAQLTESQAELEALQTSLPNPGQGIDIYNALVDLSGKWNINILNIVASSPIPPNDSESGPTLPYSLTMQGSRDNTLAFISNLIQSTELLQGLELKNINIQSGASSDDPDTVDLELYIHTWPDFTSTGQDISQVSGSKK
jgi:Tfp pilus assembly protein PilO